jgi:hypothetical protein
MTYSNADLGTHLVNDLSRDPEARLSKEQKENRNEVREAKLCLMKEKGVITREDLSELDSIGRKLVCRDHWDICDHAAQSALKYDANPMVREARKTGEILEDFRASIPPARRTPPPKKSVS